MHWVRLRGSGMVDREMLTTGSSIRSPESTEGVRLRALIDCGGWQEATKENLSALKATIAAEADFFSRHAILVRDTKGKLGDGAGSIKDIQERHLLLIDAIDKTALEKFIRAGFNIVGKDGRAESYAPDHAGSYPRLLPLDPSEPLWGYDVTIKYRFYKKL